MYKPISAYIEDHSHKLIIYKTIIENFVDTIKKKFYISPLKSEIDKLEEWLENKFRKVIDDLIKNYDYYLPTLKHVVDRMRTSDEILKSLIRIKEESNWGKNKNIIFLGDGIHMFRHHEFPPREFTDFFYKFITEYKINYFSFSKTCRLRDAQGNFLLPIWARIVELEPFIVKLPRLSRFTKSNTFLIRMIKDGTAMRFDTPDYYSTTEVINVLRNLIQYSPQGYPLSLEEAHNASNLLQSEKNKLEVEFIQLKHDKELKAYIANWRHKILRPK